MYLLLLISEQNKHYHYVCLLNYLYLRRTMVTDKCEYRCKDCQFHSIIDKIYKSSCFIEPIPIARESDSPACRQIKLIK